MSAARCPKADPTRFRVNSAFPLNCQLLFILSYIIEKEGKNS